MKQLAKLTGNLCIYNSINELVVVSEDNIDNLYCLLSLLNQMTIDNNFLILDDSLAFINSTRKKLKYGEDFNFKFKCLCYKDIIFSLNMIIDNLIYELKLNNYTLNLKYLSTKNLVSEKNEISIN